MQPHAMKRSVALLWPFALIASAWAAAQATHMRSEEWRQSPGWTKDLVIYEIATKAFTSPTGPESGTFESLKARMPYLQDLGITGIWLTGHSLSDPHHFYNIWTQYAVIEPDQIDPSLGTPAQFKALIDEAHQRGIKVFLDVITHGVMPSSSLIQRHPDWFRGGSYSMVDYDWKGGHTDLDDWWVKVWTDYVTEYGVDGFRLDVDIFRPDLWSRIRQNAATAGHPIVIFSEMSPVIPGVTDFTQGENPISGAWFGEDTLDVRYTDDIPGLYRQRFAGSGDYRVELEYRDGQRAEGNTVAGGSLHVQNKGYTTDRLHYQPTPPLGRSDYQLTVNGLAILEIKDAVVTRLDPGGPDRPRRWTSLPNGGVSVSSERHGASVDLYLDSVHGYSPSVQLSCHDNGWTGFPSDKNPYAAEGSRSIFGYSFLFTPMIPIFMAGEEFDADFHPLPELSPDLYGDNNPGKGRWLYGAQLDWTELEQSRHRGMFEDVRKMLTLRKQEHEVLASQLRGDMAPQLIAVPYESSIAVPVPYMRWKGSIGIIVAGNRNVRYDARLRLHVPTKQLDSSSSAKKYRVTDLWNDGRGVIRSADQLKEWSIVIRRDKTPRGGLAVLKIEALP